MESLHREDLFLGICSNISGNLWGLEALSPVSKLVHISSKCKLFRIFFQTAVYWWLRTVYLVVCACFWKSILYFKRCYPSIKSLAFFELYFFRRIRRDFKSFSWRNVRLSQKGNLISYYKAEEQSWSETKRINLTIGFFFLGS